MTTRTIQDLSHKKLVQSSDIISSQIGSDIVVMHAQTGAYLGLNPVAAAIFSMLSEPQTADEIVDKLMLRYEVDRAQCAAESVACLNDMLNRELIREV